MVVLWMQNSGPLVGAVVTLELAEPASVNGEWLGVVNDCTPGASPAYYSVPYRQAGDNLGQVSVWVDLTRLQVVGVVPTPDPRYQWTPVGTPEPVGEATWPSNTCPGD